MVTALLLANLEQSAAEKDRLDMQARSRRQWDSHENVDPHSAAHYGIWVYKPVTRLAVLDSGLDPYVGVTAHLVAHHPAAILAPPIAETNRYARWTEPTAAGIIAILIPFIIIMAGAGSLAEERSRGTLRQILAEGVSPKALAAGKLLGLLGGLLVLLAPGALVAGSLATVSAGSPAAWWAVGAIMYLVTWVGISVAVSALASNRSAVLVILLGIFVVVTLVIPRLSAASANAKFPVPNKPTLESQVRESFGQASRAKGDYASQRAHLITRLLKKYGANSEADLKVNPDGFLMDQTEIDQAKARDSVYDAVNEAYRKQDDLVANAPSPTSAFLAISGRFAGTDGESQRSFALAVEHYRRDWVHRLNMYLALHTKPGEYKSAPPEAFHNIPEFRYAGRVGGGPADLLRLVGWAAASLAAAFFGVALMRQEAA